MDLARDTAGDQAAGLRRLFGSRKAYAVAFISGRESCGRMPLLVRTAHALAQAGQGVVIIDEQVGAESAHAALGIKPQHDLLDVPQKNMPLEQLVQPVSPCLGILPAARLAAATAKLDALAAKKIGMALGQLQAGCAFILVNCATHPNLPLSSLALATPYLAVVAGAQGAAITRAYALIKRLSLSYGRDGFHVAITQARTEQEAQVIFHNMQHTARAHVHVDLHYLGSVRVSGSAHLAHALPDRLVSATGDEHPGFRPFVHAPTAVNPRAKEAEPVF